MSTQLRLSRAQVLATTVPPTTLSTTTTTSPPEVQEEVVETDPDSMEEEVLQGKVAVRVGATPDGVLDLLGWMLRLFSSGAARDPSVHTFSAVAGCRW